MERRQLLSRVWRVSWRCFQLQHRHSPAICRQGRCCGQRAEPRAPLYNIPAQDAKGAGSLSPPHPTRRCACGPCRKGSCSGRSGCRAGTAIRARPIPWRCRRTAGRLPLEAGWRPSVMKTSTCSTASPARWCNGWVTCPTSSTIWPFPGMANVWPLRSVARTIFLSSTLTMHFVPFRATATSADFELVRPTYDHRRTVGFRELRRIRAALRSGPL